MFYVIGLGLGDAKDVSVKGLEIIKKCSRVYLEAYTSILTVGKDKLEEFYGREVIVADREIVESAADDILKNASTEDVAFLVVGDPFGATTHTDLVLRAKQKDIDVEVLHNASIMTAVGCCGLQLYSFGETVSIPFWTDTWKPDSFFDKILDNYKRGLHTLCLLDIKVHEPTLESLTLKKKVYMPPKFMSVSIAAHQLLKIILDFSDKPAVTEMNLAVALARVGTKDQKIFACSLAEMALTDLGPPLHCLVIPAKRLHPLEVDYLIQYVHTMVKPVKDGEIQWTQEGVKSKYFSY